MKVLTRGVPNFVYTQTQEVANLEAFIANHDMMLRRLLNVTAEYRQPASKCRVSLYLEGIEDNRKLLERYCANPDKVSMRSCVVKIAADSTVYMSGIRHRIETGQGLWYMIEPKLDPRYPAMLADLRRRESKAAAQAAADMERDEGLLQEIEDLASAMGYEEAIRRLKFKDT